MLQSKTSATMDPQQQQQQQQQQQWMAMQMQQQYPTAAMLMQHHPMMPPPQASSYQQHYQAQHHHHYMQHYPQHQQQQQNQSSDEIRTVWVGDLHYWMDENYLLNCFGHTGEVLSTKVIRNKQTGQSECYGFVEFNSRAAAEKVLQSYNGTAMPSTDQPFRLNWASFSMGERRSDVGSDCSIFVGDLSSDVTDTLLQETFASRFPSVKGAKVVIDANTGRSKGYGFVRFNDDSERLQAMVEMNGVFCSSRPMRVGVATPRKSSGLQQGSFASNGKSFQSEGDSNNVTIFVGGLDPNASEEDLKQAFSQYGDIASVKIPMGKGCGFVQFVNRNNAEEALEKLNGTVIGKQMIRLSWGRNPANKQPRGDQSQWSGGVAAAYYGGQVYDGGYGYAAGAVPPPLASQDPGMYAYGAYPMV